MDHIIHEMRYILLSQYAIHEQELLREYVLTILYHKYDEIILSDLVECLSIISLLCLEIALVLL
ncbi:hypothetical protein GW750_03905 [bacterium]|nr:hypothetical protein [bacterium]